MDLFTHFDFMAKGNDPEVIYSMLSEGSSYPSGTPVSFIDDKIRVNWDTESLYFMYEDWRQVIEPIDIFNRIARTYPNTTSSEAKRNLTTMVNDLKSYLSVEKDGLYNVYGIPETILTKDVETLISSTETDISYIKIYEELIVIKHSAWRILTFYADKCLVWIG